MIHVVLLSGGKGTRMKSDLPKVLHPVLGVPIINRLLASVLPLCPKPTLIVGHKAEQVIAATGNAYHYVLQKEQLGTGHAIQCAKADLVGRSDIDTILVLPGDHPLISTDTLLNLIQAHEQSEATITLGTTVVTDYEGDRAVFEHYGRVIRDSTNVVDRIVEYKDASPEERAVREVNVSYYCFNATWLWQNIDSLRDTNASKEFYLTDLIHIAKEQGKKIEPFIFSNIECLGVNTPEQLAQVEQALS